MLVFLTKIDLGLVITGEVGVGGSIIMEDCSEDVEIFLPPPLLSMDLLLVLRIDLISGDLLNDSC